MGANKHKHTRAPRRHGAETRNRADGHTDATPHVDLKLGYRPALDGVRAFAVMSVMAWHFVLPGLKGGFLGVDVFFVLSGFLITSLLVEEWQAAGSIPLGRFYMRRVLRLFPALFVVLLVTAPFVFEDFRGRNLETYNERLFHEAGIPRFVQDSHTVSRRNVLRGIHGDDRTWKLLSCPLGAIYVVVVNNIAGHAQYRKWEGFTLTDRNHAQLLVPPMFGNGHLVLSEEAILAYKLSEYTDTAGQFTLAWNDPTLGIRWPVGVPLLSARDAEPAGIYRNAAFPPVGTCSKPIVLEDMAERRCGRPIGHDGGCCA